MNIIGKIMEVAVDVDFVPDLANKAVLLVTDVLDDERVGHMRQHLALHVRAYVLGQGEVVLQGPANELASQPAVKEVYLGSA